MYYELQEPVEVKKINKKQMNSGQKDKLKTEPGNASHSLFRLINTETRPDSFGIWNFD